MNANLLTIAFDIGLMAASHTEDRVVSHLVQEAGQALHDDNLRALRINMLVLNRVNACGYTFDDDEIAIVDAAIAARGNAPRLKRAA